jgi:serine/threonine protein kinase
MKENLNVHLFISSMVYSINHNQVIGSGSFGTIFKAKALKLHRTEECGDKAERLKLIFSKKKMALKKLKEDTKGYVKKGYKVDQKRELLIL